ncbi:hypothetical protein ACQ5ES_07570 [Pseudidiomarina sp. E22-M8]|uniref:hypothetical protein n=1 Tax=Pseudidiomarina sp. E22-M8 TaxID=3424768 RepID=UPI00403CAF17
MKPFWQLLATLTLITSVAACSGGEQDHGHNDDGSHMIEETEATEEGHEHGEDTHLHDEQQPETEVYYGDEEQHDEESHAAKEEDSHTHDDGEEHSHH